MGMVKGNTLFGRALERQGVDTMFYIMGGPINDALRPQWAKASAASIAPRAGGRDDGPRLRARAAHDPASAWARPGPATINLAHRRGQRADRLRAAAWRIGGASPVARLGTGAFQEIDQVAIMQADHQVGRAHLRRRAHPGAGRHRVPSGDERASPGPVYLDMPGDVLYEEVDEDKVHWPRRRPMLAPTSAGDPAPSTTPSTLLAQGRAPADRLPAAASCGRTPRPTLQQFVEPTGIPFYTTPQGRGVVPDDHALSFSDRALDGVHARPTSCSSSARGSTT